MTKMRMAKVLIPFATALCLMGGLGLAFADDQTAASDGAAASTEAAAGVEATADQTSGAGSDASGDASGQASGDTASADVTASSGATSVDDDPENVVDPSQRADNSFIYDTSIAALADEATLYNDQVVQVAGEVIGDRIASDTAGFCWITVEDEAPNDSSSISVLMSDTLADQIDSYGRYGVTGSRVQVRGEYHQACPEHDGLADIHATSVEVVSAGEYKPDTFNPKAFIPGIVLVGVGLVLTFAFNAVRERMK